MHVYGIMPSPAGCARPPHRLIICRPSLLTTDGAPGPDSAGLQAVADATYFLPAYDCRQATLALAALREQQEAAAAALQPRKKFAFNRKAPAASSGAQKAPAAAAEPPASRSSQPQPAAPQPQQQQQQRQQQPSDGSEAPAGGSGSTICGLRGQVVAPGREAAAGQEFTLSDLEDCTVFLLAPLAALFMHGLRRCRVYTGPVAGACFVEGARCACVCGVGSGWGGVCPPHLGCNMPQPGW